MSRTVGILSATTALFAASTLYLAWHVGIERERSIDLAASRSPATETRAAAATPGGERRDDSSAEAAPAEAQAETEERATIPGLSDQSVGSGTGRDRRRPPRGMYNELAQKDFQNMYKDPVTRRQLVEEQIPELRDRFVKLERRLDLSADLWQRFLETLAEQSLESRNIFATCGKDPECVKRVATAELYARHKQQIQDVLGEADARKYETFNYSTSERQGVEALQARLPKFQQLSEKTSEDLIVALSDVRREAAQRLASDGKKLAMVRGEGLVLVYPQELETPDERIAFAREHMAELRKRAATLLNGSQLAVYDRMQGPAFRSISRALRNQSIQGR